MQKCHWLVLILLLAAQRFALSQESQAYATEDEGRSRALFFHFRIGTENGGHKQAGYYDGTHTRFTFGNLYATPQIKNDIDYNIGYTTYLGEYPPAMRYQWNMNASAGLNWYLRPSLALFIRAELARTTCGGAFTLYAVNPANPYGDPLVFQQQMRGLETRTWIETGVRFESEPYHRGEINPFFDVLLIGGGIKPERNEAAVAGKKYNLFTYNPNYSTDSRIKYGYGAGISLGCISWLKRNTSAEISVNAKLLFNSPLTSDKHSLYYGLTFGCNL